MTEGNIKIHRWLYPITWLYGLVVGLRNKLFDRGWLRSKSFDVPILCVGNLAVGGTGKTPHTEYLIKILHQQGLHVATLSRGYKRKTKGYLLADERSDAHQVGDEPMQMKEKYPFVRVAVDEKRCHGIEQLLKLEQPPVDVILLDDAFQHRYVKAGMNILLTDYHRLLCDDALLPAGRLREPASGKHRAQIIIVTKCPDDIKPIEFNIISKRLKPYPYQQLYFSRLQYGTLRPLFLGEKERKEEGEKEISLVDSSTTSLSTPSLPTTDVLLVTGIASPTPLLEEVKRRARHVRLLAFDDHHDFTASDMQLISREFEQLPSGERLIITTEKDAVRLKVHPALDEALRPHIHVLPIEVAFLQNQQTTFNQNIIDYVRKNPRNRNLSEGKDAHST